MEDDQIYVAFSEYLNYINICHFVFPLFLLVGVFFVWKRYNLVLEKNEVNPTRLLDSGRIRPRNVLIISNVDNRHHIDIVLAFSKYLKAHCAVGEVYFALDPHTGITSQADHDPWKWAQVINNKESIQDLNFQFTKTLIKMVK